MPEGSDNATRDWILWGVAFVAVCGLPPPQETAGKVRYDFTVEHDPLDENYGHSELRVYKNGRRETDKKKINPAVKKIYRQLLSEQIRVVLEPLI